MRANKVHNEIKTAKITPRAREPYEMCRGEMRSSLGVVKLGILRLHLSRGLDARGCRLLRRRSVMPWWRRGSYATTNGLSKAFLLEPNQRRIIISLFGGVQKEDRIRRGALLLFLGFFFCFSNFCSPAIFLSGENVVEMFIFPLMWLSFFIVLMASSISEISIPTFFPL